MEELQATEKRLWSRSAVASAVLGVLCFTMVGMLAIPLGIIGLVNTRANKRRGRKAAKWGLGLGLLSLCANTTGCPQAFYPPPIGSEDRALCQFLDDMQAGRYEQLRGNIRVANSEKFSPTEFVKWVDAFNDINGAGHMVWPVSKSIFGDWARSYRMRFEKTGTQTFLMYLDDNNRWLLFLPRACDPQLSDRYRYDLTSRDPAASEPQRGGGL